MTFKTFFWSARREKLSNKKSVIEENTFLKWNRNKNAFRKTNKEIHPLQTSTKINLEKNFQAEVKLLSEINLTKNKRNEGQWTIQLFLNLI